MGGKYTAYQLYQNSQFQQASRAKVEPYRQAAYQCPHSQRALMQQFSQFQQRTHYDAAYLGCCDEPVQIFGIQPQYADELNPPKAKDCGQKPTEQPCYTPRLQVIGTLSRCANEGSVLTTGRVSIECHQACREFAAIPKNGGTWVGRHGSLKIIGTKGNLAILEYKLKDSLRAEVWDGCLDNQTWTEYFCGQAVIFSVSGGLTSPEGCYCDCCGVNGTMSVPTLLMTAQYSPVGADIWSNTFDFGNILVTGLCKDYQLNTSFLSFYSDDSADPSWTVGPTYTGDLRSLSGTLNGAGGEWDPVCCGGVFNLGVYDSTCGNAYDIHNNYNFPSMITNPIQVDEDPVGWQTPGGQTVLSDNNIYTLTAWPACAYAGDASMSVANKVWNVGLGTDYECSETTIGTTQKGDGQMSVEIETHIKDTATCKACCGRAKMEVYAKDGCGGTSPVKTFYIFEDYDPGNPWLGWKVWCAWDGVNWREYKDKLFCDGSLEGSPSYLSANLHSTEANCKLGLNVNAPGLCGSGGLSTCSTCCHYAMNSTGTSGKVVCAESATCCQWEEPDGPYLSGSWTNGYWGICCSHVYQPS